MDAPPQLSLFAFHLSLSGAERLRPERGAGPTRTEIEDENAATRALIDGVTARGRVMLTGCDVDGRFLGRVCVLSFRTRQDRIDACVEDIAAEAAAILARSSSHA
jgi:aromatic-L-amino-acid decarboxylase